MDARLAAPSLSHELSRKALVEILYLGENEAFVRGAGHGLKWKSCMDACYSALGQMVTVPVGFGWYALGLTSRCLGWLTRATSRDGIMWGLPSWGRWFGFYLHIWLAGIVVFAATTYHILMLVL